MDTVQSVVKALNRAGFSANDYRTIDAATPEEAASPMSQITGLFDAKGILPESDTETDAPGDFTLGAISTEWNTVETGAGSAVASDSPIAESVAFVESIKAQATEQNKEFEERSKNSNGDDIPVELEAKMNKHKLKDIFSADAKALKLPQFFLRVTTGGWFEDGDALQLLERDELLKNFKLSQADSNINFEDVVTEMYRVDLELQGDQNYAPKPFKMDAAGRSKFNAIILSGSKESQIRNVTARITELIGNMYPITDQEVKKYVQRVIESMAPEQIQDCLERDVAYVAKIKQKISALASVHAFKEFNNLLDVDKIVVQPSFIFPETITPSANAPALPKSLYGTEASMGTFEGKVINDVANIEGIAWWHRNLSRGKGFRINGFLNHYPDFILKTKSGKIIVLETKGDDRDNSDSELKLKLGKLWESRAGRDYRYIMVFENNPIDGAERLSDALNKIGQL